MNTKFQEDHKRISGIWQRVAHTHRWAGNAEVPLTMHLARTSHVVKQALEQALDFDPSHIRILFAALEPEGIIQSSLSKLYKVDPAAITRTIQTMEREGLVYRAADPNDNRSMRIFVTEKGQLLAHTLPGKIAAFEAMLTEGLTDDEILGMHRILTHMDSRLTSTGNAGFYNKEGKSDSNESELNK